MREGFSRNRLLGEPTKRGNSGVEPWNDGLGVIFRRAEPRRREQAVRNRFWALL
jgi:hypothetical protein